MNLNLWSKQLSAYFPCLLLFEVISTAADLYIYLSIYILLPGGMIQKCRASVSVMLGLHVSTAKPDRSEWMKAKVCTAQTDSLSLVEGEQRGSKSASAKLGSIYRDLKIFSVTNRCIQSTGIAYKTKYQFKF